MAITVSPASRGATVAEIDGLRGLAILAVLFTHLWPSTGPASVFSPVASAGWIGVDLFFVISGFLIMGILIDTRESPTFFRDFYARRILRIFPLYYLFLGAIFLAVVVSARASWFHTGFGRAAGSPWWYLLYATNLRQAFVGLDVPPTIRPLWSLAIEEQFYLIFPLIVYRLRPDRLWVLLLALIVAAPCVRLALYLVDPPNHQLQYLLTPARFDTIAMGGLGAVLLRSPHWPAWRKYLPIAAAFAVVSMGVLIVTTGLDRRAVALRLIGFSVIAFAFLTLTLWAVDRRGARATGLLRHQSLRRMGLLCYGLYILHVVVVLGMARAAARAGVPWLLSGWFKFPVGVAGSVAAALLSWHLFEKPILRLKRYFAYRMPATDTAMRDTDPPIMLAAAE